MLIGVGCHPPAPSGGPKGKGDSSTPALKLPDQRIVLTVLAPAGHFPSWLLEEFEARTQKAVKLVTYRNWAEALTWWNEGQVVPDLVALPDFAIKGAIEAQKLAPLDLTQLQSWPRTEPLYLHHSFDPKNTFTMPYAATFLAVMVQPDGPAWKSWADIFRLMEDGQADFDASWPWVDTKTALTGKIETKKVEAVQTKEPAPTRPEAKIRVGLQTDLKKIITENPTWKWVIPTGPGLMVLYHGAIGAQAQQPAAAYEFLHWFLAPENAARLAKENYWTTPQPASQLLLDPVLKKELQRDAKYLDGTVFLHLSRPEPPRP
jgi:spermidine/putrescine transport system substrate-binding protein